MKSAWRAEIHDIHEIHQKATEFLVFLNSQDYRIVAFHGAMGAGKTTFIKSLIAAMGSADEVSSPTFAILNQYETRSYGVVYHADFYRIKSVAEALDIGVDELLDGRHWFFIEWPENLGNLLPEEHVKVKIMDQNGSRIIEAEL